jgi:transcription initiation factor TFIIH subunit 4
LPTATGAGGVDSKGEGFIVLETNYRIYAYTGPLILLRESHKLGPQLAPLSFSPDNPLQTAVLNLFVTLKSRFPNLVVGSITRDSVKRALLNGITADQVGCFQYSLHEEWFVDSGVPAELRSSAI